MTDQTYYVCPDDAILTDLGWAGHSEKDKPAPPAKDFMFSFEGDPKKEKLQRGILCSCYSKQRCALTARETDRLAVTIAEAPRKIPKIDTKPHVSRSGLLRWPTDVDKERRVDNAQIARRIWRLIPDFRALGSGLIVFAGETGSRKTTFAREIARRHVSAVMHAEYLRVARLRAEGKDAKADRPHIVTYEDPIESWFAASPAEASNAGFDYTPRQKGEDVESLQVAVANALRQKPALLYVNEVRSKPEWEWLLFFAGTGHLAITTTHAGSLVETFGRILGAAGAKTSAMRSEVASRIVAIIHVRKIEGELVPALWVQTARSRTGMTQEGLGSLLPSMGGGCFGRAHFARALELPDNVFKAAVKADLNGD